MTDDPLAPLLSACAAETARVWAGQRDGAHDVAHLWRVWHLARQIARAEGTGDLRVLAAAAMLHDIVNLPKDSPQRARAAALSADHATRFLATLPFATALIPRVAHAIAAHSFSGGVAPETDEARILQDADRIEALGALGVARNMVVAGQMGAAILDPVDPLAGNRPLNDRAFALDHFETKLLPIAEALHTATARAIAAPRVAFMRAFRAQLVAEIALPDSETGPAAATGVE